MTPTTTTITPTELTAIRRAGGAVTTTAIDESASLVITDQSTYTAAEIVLLKVRAARKSVAQLIEERIDCIIKPIRTGLDKLYETRRQLLADLDEPLATAETRVKKKMADFQIAERRRVEQERQEREAEQRRLNQEAQRREQEAAQAKTVQQKKTANEAAELLRLRAEEVRVAPVVSTPVSVASSARFIKYAEVTDMDVFVKAVLDGTIPMILLQVNEDVLKQYFTDDRAIVSAWPGVTVKEKSQIAGRRS